MAIQNNFDEDDEDQQNQSGEQVLAGESAQMGPNTGGSQQQGQAGAPSKSGAWTNLMDYVGANQGNDAKMGDDIKSNIAGRANEATSAGNQFKSSADQKINEGSVYDNGLSDAVRTNAQDVAENRTPEFQNAWDAYYKGPDAASDVEGFGDVANQFNTVEQRAKNAQTHEGRKTLLDDQYNRPTYSAGEKTLDSFILGAGDQGRQKLGEINQGYSNYGGGWNDLVGQVTGNIGQGRSATEQTKQNVHQAFDDAYGSYENTLADLNTKLAAENAAKPQKYNDLMQRFSHGDLSAWDEAGVNGLSPTQFINAMSMSGPRSLGDLASDDDIANYQALLELGNRQGNYSADQLARTGLGDNYFNLDRNAITEYEEPEALGTQELDPTIVRGSNDSSSLSTNGSAEEPPLIKESRKAKEKAKKKAEDEANRVTKGASNKFKNKLKI